MDHDSENPPRRGGTVMLVLAWLLLFAGLFWFFSDWNERQFNPNSGPIVTSGDALILQRNRSGHYVAPGLINGERVTFLLDTGATQIALPASLAAKLALRRGANVNIQTANGNVTGYQTRLQSVALGPIVINDVSALVTEGLSEDAVLLGMSFLKHVEFTQRGDQLMLRPLPAAAP